MKSYAVIGAGFGDEGKGLITDHLVRYLRSKVVARFNGGGQASHTVVTPTGLRHVFSSASAGTLAGASTYFGQHFIVNPYVIDAEMAELQSKGFQPDLYCHPEARVTTIFDMAVNAAIELHRGDARHGSCGIGINETVTRHERGFTLTAQDLRMMSRKELREQLKLIHQHWVPARLKELGIEDLPTSFHLKTGEVLKNDNYDEHVIRLMMGALHLYVGDTIGPAQPLDEINLVLEGAQGLMLDEQLGTFPHVTRSLTGLPWAMETADHAWHQHVVPVYITRAYATRHGAGELRHEGEFITADGNLIDTTNVPNDWQGRIRFAPLDLQELKKFIDLDLRRAHRLVRENPYHGAKLEKPMIALTCLDQLGAHVRVYDAKGKITTLHREDLPQFVTEQVGVTVSMVSRGPTSSDVEHLVEIGV